MAMLLTAAAGVIVFLAPSTRPRERELELDRSVGLAVLAPKLIA